MELDDLILSLDRFSIQNDIDEDIILKIIQQMHIISESGQNDYSFEFKKGININLIFDKLKTYFPDINIYLNDKYLFIDWS
jgi:hypothetical protein